jgi:hypothetical protein
VHEDRTSDLYISKCTHTGGEAHSSQINTGISYQIENHESQPKPLVWYKGKVVEEDANEGC